MAFEPQDIGKLCGYRPNREETVRYIESLPVRRLGHYADIMAPREKVNVDIWRALIKCKPGWQRGSQAIGSCVAWGAELVSTMTLAVMAQMGQSEWVEEAATEPIYGGCRVEANGGKLGGYQDGSWGSAAAEWLEKGGVLLRTDYSQETGISEQNLTKYDGDKEKEWGNYGCGGKDDARQDYGGKLDQIAQLHPFESVTQVGHTDELTAALSNGYCVSTASMMGYGNMKRNADGVCRISGEWAHQMMWGGIRWLRDEPQYRLFQSWGKSCSGPDPGIDDEAISWCSWWTTKEDAARHLRADDSFAFSNLEGFPPQKLDWSEVATSWNWGRYANYV